jgi:hypothetical protein
MSKYNMTVTDDAGSVSIEAVLNKLGGIRGARRLLRGELEVREAVRCWIEEGSLFFVEVTSDGTTGEQWIARLERKGFRLSDFAKGLLCSDQFQPTSSGVTYHIAVLPGKLFSDDDRVSGKIRAEADRRGFEAPNAEVACLLREHLSDADLEAMGFQWLVTMHGPIEDSCGVPLLLGIPRGDGVRWLGACYGRPFEKRFRSFGFAFVVPQASSPHR